MALERELQRLKDLVENTSDFIWEMDVDGALTYLNPSVGNLLGYRAQEIIGKAPFFLMEPGEARRVKSFYEKMLVDKKPFYNLEYALIHKDGQRLHMETSGVPVFDDQGELEGYQGISRDVTRRRKDQVALASRYQFERIISKISWELVNTPVARISRAIDYALQLCGGFFQVDRSYLFQFSPDGRTMDNTYEWCREGIEPQGHTIQGFPMSGVPWFMSRLRDQGYFYMPDLTALPPGGEAEKKEFQRQGIQSVLCLPILDQGQFTGFLGFDSVEEKKGWTREETRQVRYLSKLLSCALARQQAEKALRDSEARLQHLTDNMTDVLWTTDLNFKATYVSPSVEKLYGIPVKEYLKRAPQERFTPASLQKIYRAKMEEMAKEKDPAADKNRTIMIELEQYRWDGSIINVVMHNKIIRDREGNPVGFQGITRDITRQKQAEKALQESERRFRQVADNIKEVFWLMSADTRELLYVNPAYENVWGMSRKEIRQDFVTTLLDSILEEDRPVFSATLERFQAGGPFNLEYRIRRPDGNICWIYTRIFCVYNEEKEVVGHAGISVDITKLKSSQEEALQASRVKSEFMAIISHELRTPLHAIRGFAELGREESLETGHHDLEEYFQKIQTSSDRLLHLINDLLDISRIETGCIDYNLEKKNLFVLALTSRNELSSLLENKGVFLDIQEPTFDAGVKVD